MRRKTTIAVDDDALERARAILGTNGIGDTIDAALAEIIRRKAANDTVERLSTLTGLDLDDPEVMARAWR